VALHLVGLAMVLFHTITWINLTPKVLVLWRGEERVSPALIAASNYLAWLVVSGVVAWVALR
jgi:fumarate reductase subunit C